MKKLIYLYLTIIFSSTLHAVCPSDPATNINDPNIFHSANQAINKFNSYYKNITCDKSLLPFEVDDIISAHLRCQLIDDINLLKSLSFKDYGPYFKKYFSPSEHYSPEQAGRVFISWLKKRIKKITMID